MLLMRTTLTIDPDVEQLLQREIRRTIESMKAVLNDALRIGLGLRSIRRPGHPSSRYSLMFSASDREFDTGRLNQLADEMEADEFARKLAK